MFLRMPFMQTGILCLVVGVGVLVGCGFSQAQSAGSADRSNKLIPAKVTMAKNDEVQLVPVSAIKFNGSKISAGVISFGCTTSADFTIQHAIVNGVCEVKINRVKRDFCKRAPFVANIELEWSQPDDCRELDIVVVNPLLITRDDNVTKIQIK